MHFDVSIYPKNIQVRVTGYYYQYIASNDLLTSVTVCHLSKHAIFNGQHPVLLSIIPTSANFFTFQRYIQSNIVVEYC